MVCLPRHAQLQPCCPHPVGTQYPREGHFWGVGMSLPDAPFLRGQGLDVSGCAHQVDSSLPPPAVPHADKVPLAHQVAWAGSGDLVRHQRVRPDTLQHLPEQGLGSYWLSLWGHHHHPLTPAQGTLNHLGDSSVGWQHEQKQQ